LRRNVRSSAKMLRHLNSAVGAVSEKIGSSAMRF
jgi:hypothetical protein